MSELSQAVSLLGAIDRAHVSQIGPNCKLQHQWTFVGLVPVDLKYRMADGSPLTQEMAEQIASLGAGLYLGSRSRGVAPKIEMYAFPTKAAAEEALVAWYAKNR